MNRTIPSILAAVLTCSFPGAALADAPGDALDTVNWPQWRGPGLNGVSPATNLPVEWSAEKNIIWKTPLPHWSGSTPVIWGDRIFVMSPSAPAPRPAEEAADDPQDQPPGGRGGRGGGGRGGRGGGRDPGGNDILLFCISKADGSILWRHKMDEGNQLHMKANHASPSPVTDGTHVWAVTGNGTVTALTMTGEVVWSRNLQQDYGPFGLNWGFAASPLLYEDRIIIPVLHGMRTDDPSYVVCFDALTGKELWRQERPTDAPAESPDAYTTPAVLRHGDGSQIVVSGGDYVTGHDPDSGRELWRAAGLNPGKQRNYRIVASPVVVGDLIYAPTRVRPLLALRYEGGESEPTTLAWKWDAQGAPDVPTPVCDGTYFYMASDNGMVTCLDARTGEVKWGPERTVQGTVSSSPILADGRIYLTNEEGVTVVLAAGPQFRMLATNELDGSYTLSSPVTSGSRLFIRTGTHLYCIGSE